MKYIFRGYVIFEYIPNYAYLERGTVIQPKIDNIVISFNHCNFIADDYALLSNFFSSVHSHMKGEKVELKDIIVS